MSTALDVTVKYEFPEGFQPAVLKGLATLLENSITGFGLTQKILQIRERDLSTDVQKALNAAINDIKQFEFQNQALINNPMPFVTASKEEVANLRRSIHDSVYRLVAYFRDFDVTVKMQLFSLTQLSAYTKDANVEHMTADGRTVDSPEALTARLAIQNLQEIQRFFDSLESSKAMTTVNEGLKVLETIEPTVAFGGLKFEADPKVFKHLEIVKF